MPFNSSDQQGQPGAVQKGIWRSGPGALHASEGWGWLVMPLTGRGPAQGCFSQIEGLSSCPGFCLLTFFPSTGSSQNQWLPFSQTFLCLWSPPTHPALFLLCLEQHLCTHHFITQLLFQYSIRMSLLPKSFQNAPARNSPLPPKVPYYRCSSCLSRIKVIYVLAYPFLLDNKLLECNNPVWIIFESITDSHKDLHWIKSML